LPGENGGKNIELLMVVMRVVMWRGVVVCACVAAAS
jgi:acetolactate synthase regulatory subunit